MIGPVSSLARKGRRSHQHDVTPSCACALELPPPPPGSDRAVPILWRLLWPAQSTTARACAGTTERWERFVSLSADMGERSANRPFPNPTPLNSCQNWGGEICRWPTFAFSRFLVSHSMEAKGVALTNCLSLSSSLYELSVSWHARMCPFSPSLPLSTPERRRQIRTGRRHYGLRQQGRLPG